LQLYISARVPHFKLICLYSRPRPRPRSLTVAAKGGLQSKKAAIDRTNRLRPAGLKEVEYEDEYEYEYDLRTKNDCD